MMLQTSSQRDTSSLQVPSFYLILSIKRIYLFNNSMAQQLYYLAPRYQKTNFFDMMIVNFITSQAIQNLQSKRSYLSSKSNFTLFHILFQLKYTVIYLHVDKLIKSYNIKYEDLNYKPILGLILIFYYKALYSKKHSKFSSVLI